MWSKLTHALKPKPLSTDRDISSSSTVSTAHQVSEARPNISGHASNEDELSQQAGTYMRSVSRSVRTSVSKHVSKLLQPDDQTANPPSLSPPIQKRIKTSRQPSDNRPPSSLSRGSSGASPGPSDGPLQLPIAPATPNAERLSGSLRSILRETNTPGTGRNIRFSARDAYRVISPDPSVTSDTELQRFSSLKPSEPSSFNPPRLRSPPTSVWDVFPPSVHNASHFPPSFTRRPSIPQADHLNPFDLSTEHEIPPIPAGLSLDDNATELTEGDPCNESMTISRPLSLPAVNSQPPDLELPLAQRSDSVSVSPTQPALSSPKIHNRSLSFSFGQTVFFSMNKSNTPSGDPPVAHLSDEATSSGTRSHSHAPLHPASPLMSSPSSFPNPSSPPPDPFGTDACTYYTPQSMIPQVPPELHVGTHFPLSNAGESLPDQLALVSTNPAYPPTIQAEDAMIASLRTQLTLQQALCTQYERDLSVRDSQLSTLHSKLSSSAQDVAARKALVRGWKKKVAELERACRFLEIQVEASAQDSMDRSVLEDASAEALRTLHVRIDALEREKQEVEGKLELLKRKSDGERNADRKGLLTRVESIESDDSRFNQVQARSAWEDERAELHKQAEGTRKTIDALALEKSELIQANADVMQSLARRDEELALLKAELEAQWGHTETSGVKLDAMQAENSKLRKAKATLEEAKAALITNVKALEKNISSMEADRAENEHRRKQLEDELQAAVMARDDAEQQRESIDALLQSEQEHIEALENALHEREDGITELTREHQYALDTISRLEENLRQRDAGESGLAQRLHTVEAEVEELRDELSRATRAHARALDAKVREAEDAQAREAEARMQMEMMFKEQAHGEVGSTHMQERTRNLEAEVEKLRRQVHDLQQGSADRDMRITRIAKERDQMREDMEGLNMALDSKQQELEMVKRKYAARAVATVTPAANNHRHSTASTASVVDTSRPPSALSDASTTTKSSTVSSTSTARASSTALGRGVRHNSNASNGSSTTSDATKKSTVPPTLKPRPSVTPTARRTSTSSISRRLAEARSPPSGLPTLSAGQRRVSSSTFASIFDRGSSSPTPSEKENFETPRAARQVSAMVGPI